MNEININEIVKIEQMPKVFSQLEKIGELIEEKTKDLNDLECTEQNKQIIKNRRTEINKTLEILEERRKEIKNKLLEPYDIFEEKYNKECKIKLQKASDLLKTKIEGIEEEQKLEKEEEIREFFEEHCKARNLDGWFCYEMITLNVTLSASMKSLKEKIIAILDEVAKAIQLIKMEEFADEIMLEYKNSLDFGNSKMKVVERHKQLELMKQREEELARKKAEEEKVIEVVEEVIEEEITAPELVEEEVEEQQMMVVAFQVTATVEQIRELKQWLKERNIQYS